MKLSCLLTTVKSLLFSGLCATHLLFFGLPTLERFLAAEVAMLEQVETQADLPAPSLTLCPAVKYFSGWKNTSELKILDILEEQCPGAASAEDFVACVEEKTFSLTDSVLSAHQGVPPVKNLSSPGFWSADVTVALQGRCFTFNYSERLGSDLLDDVLYFNLNSKTPLTYTYFIDTNDFFMTT